MLYPLTQTLNIQTFCHGAYLIHLNIMLWYRDSLVLHDLDHHIGYDHRFYCLELLQDGAAANGLPIYLSKHPGIYTKYQLKTLLPLH